MNVTVEKLSKEVVNHLLSKIGNMESNGIVEIHMTKSQKWDVARQFLGEVREILSKAIVVNSPYTAAFDGGATPNPGLMKIGGWIRNPDGIKVYSYTEEIGNGTNNEAEYYSLIKLLEEIRRRGIKNVHVQGDSALVVNQVNGAWKAKDPRMKELRDHALRVAYGLELNLTHVLRDLNSEADSLT